MLYRSSGESKAQAVRRRVGRVGLWYAGWGLPGGGGLGPRGLSEGGPRSEFVIQMSAELVSFGADLTLRPLIVGLCSLTCGHFKNMTILGLGISLPSYSRKCRSLAGSVVQWEALQGLPAMPGWAREGRDFPASVETCLSGPQAWVCSTASSRGHCLPRTMGSSPCPQGRGASTWEVPGRRVPWWVLLPRNPGSMNSFRPLFSRVTDWLI